MKLFGGKMTRFGLAIALGCMGVVAAIALGGCAESSAAGAHGVPAQMMASLKGELAANYPDWQVEYITPQWVDGPDAVQIGVRLKWKGAESIRIYREFWYGANSIDHILAGEDILMNKKEAQSFVSAFAAKHPEPDWVISAPLDVSIINSGQGSIQVDYATMVQKGKPGDHTEYWKAAPGPKGHVWTFYGLQP